jgi:hypothetical protein
MPRRKKVEVVPTKFAKVYEMPHGNFVINQGDLIKINDEWGMKFKFDSLVTNVETGAQWVDCFEVHKLRTGSLRSFSLDRVKRIPTRRGRRAKRGTASPAPEQG